MLDFNCDKTQPLFVTGGREGKPGAKPGGEPARLVATDQKCVDKVREIAEVNRAIPPMVLNLGPGAQVFQCRFHPKESVQLVMGLAGIT